jgi:hypothetical protein
MPAAFCRKLTSLLLLAIVFCFEVSAQEAPNPFSSQAKQLVTELMSRAGAPGFVTLNVDNRSSLATTDVAAARKALEAQLRSANARLVKPERAVAEINVTISENLHGLLWIAQVKQGLTTQTITVQGDKQATSATMRAPVLTVKRTPLFVQEDGTQIVDFALLDSKTLFVLEPDRLAAYYSDGNRWAARNAVAIRHSQPWPRDLRGHISMQQAQLTVFLPGVQCIGVLSADNALQSLNCNETDDPWLLSDGKTNAFFPASRNFFSGIIRGMDISLPPFYSAATVGDANPISIFTGTDGRARLYASFTQAPHVYSGWGSDIAAVRSACGAQWQVLVSRPGDRTQPDAIQAMEISNREPVPVSSALELPGSITSLWQSTDGKSVNMVTRDVLSKTYEASILSIDCR